MLQRFWALIVKYSMSLIFICAILIGSFYILNHPGQLDADASQYHEISQSLIAGKGFVLEGELSMEREPLYPVFRAGLFLLGFGISSILWIQLFLVVIALFIFMVVLRRFSQRYAYWAGLISALYPGFMVWPSLHLSESLSIFLLAVLAYFYDVFIIRGSRSQVSWWKFLVLGIVCGLLILTKAAYMLLPFVVAAAIFFQSQNKRLFGSGIFLVTVFVTLFPWLYRNHSHFHRWSVTNRSGWMVYARSIKSEYSFSQILQTGISVLTGESLLVAIDSAAQPIVRQQWIEPLQSVIAMRSQGVPYVQIDREFMQRGTAKLFSRPVNIVHYVAWIPVEALRLLAFVSPRSPLFNVEQMFIVEARSGSLSYVKVLLLITIHILQLIWFFLLTIGLYASFRRNFFYQAHIILVLYTIGIYVLFDAIARYSAPVFPFLVFIAFIGFEVVKNFLLRIGIFKNVR